MTQTAGSGPVLVMVPGLGLQAPAWEPTREALAAARPELETRPVLLPGYGVAPGRREQVDPRALAGRLVDELPADRPVVLCGHSASCQVVAHAAVQARTGGSADVRALVLIGPTTDPRSPTWAGLARRWLATARHEPPWQVPMLVRHYRRTGLAGIARTMNAARKDPIAATLGDLRLPVLLLRGPHDRIAPADWLAALARTGAGPGSHVDLPAGGHMVPLTHGGLVAEAIGAFLAASVRG